MLESWLYFLSIPFLSSILPSRKLPESDSCSRHHFLLYVMSKIAAIGGKSKRNRGHRTRNKNLCTLVVEEIFFLTSGKGAEVIQKKGELGVFFGAKLCTYVNCVHLF